MGRESTKRELEKRVEGLEKMHKDDRQRIAELEAWQADAVIAFEEMEGTDKVQQAKLAYYENPNSPPSKQSLA